MAILANLGLQVFTGCIQSGAKILGHFVYITAPRSPYSMLRGEYVLKWWQSLLATTLFGREGEGMESLPKFQLLRNASICHIRCNIMHIMRKIRQVSHLIMHLIVFSQWKDVAQDLLKWSYLDNALVDFNIFFFILSRKQIASSDDLTHITIKCNDDN